VFPVKSDEKGRMIPAEIEKRILELKEEVNTCSMYIFDFEKSV